MRWAGDDPTREGLLDTPARVARAYEEFFSGYGERSRIRLLKRTFEETDGYDEMVVLRDIRFESHCEHHMVPIIGKRPYRLSAAPARGRHQQARPRASRSTPAACRSRRS